MLTFFDAFSFVGSFFVLFVFFVYILAYFPNRRRFYTDPESKKLPTVSIAVPAKNESKTIAKTLQSLLNLDYPKKLLEIIAVNDGSTDNTGKIMDSFKKFGVKVIHKKNGGKASALNIALEKARGEIFVCMDADSFAEKNVLMKSIGYFKDPKMASVTSSVKVYKPRNMLTFIQFIEYLVNILTRKIFAVLDSVFVVPGAFALYRTSVVKELGGFDEKNLTEDMEIAMRLQDHGYKIESSANAYTHTCAPETLKQFFRQRVRWYQGFLANSRKYKHLYFNVKYGNLGLFALPIYMIFVGFLIFFVSTTIYYTVSTVYHLANISLLSGIFDIPISNIGYPLFYVGTMTIIWALNIVFFFAITYQSYVVSRERLTLKAILALVLQLTFYSIVLAAVWITSIYRELRGVETKW